MTCRPRIPKLRARLVELNVPACQRATSRITVGQLDAEGVRVPTGLALISHFDVVGVPRHPVDLGAALEAAARGSGRPVLGDARRLHVHTGVVIDVVEVDVHRPALEPRIDAEAGATVAYADPPAARDEVIAPGTGRTARAAVDIAASAGQDHFCLEGPFQGEVDGVDRDLPGARARTLNLLVDEERRCRQVIDRDRPELLVCGK